MIVTDTLSPQEIFRLIKNGDCAIFQFEEWLEELLEDYYSMREYDTGPVA